MSRNELYFSGQLADRFSIDEDVEKVVKNKKKQKVKKDTQPSIGYSKLDDKHIINGKRFKCRYATTGTCVEKDSNGNIIQEKSCPLYFKCTTTCNRWDRDAVCKKCPCKQGEEEYEIQIEIMHKLIEERIDIEKECNNLDGCDAIIAFNRIVEIDRQLYNNPHYDIPNFLNK